MPVFPKTTKSGSGSAPSTGTEKAARQRGNGRFVTQYQIAREAGVSRSTVQAVLSGSSIQISDSVKHRVMEVAERLNYSPNRFAQIMRSGKSHQIGILHFGDLYELSERKVVALSEVLAGTPYEPLVLESLWFLRGEDDVAVKMCRNLMESRVAGIVIVNPGTMFRQEHLDSLLETGIPVVSIEGRDLKGVPDYGQDRVWGYRQMVTHILESGRKNIALIADKASSLNEGAAQALKACPSARLLGVSWSVPYPKPVYHKPFNTYNAERGREAIKEILRWRKRPDAVICSNDEVALGALTGCSEMGVRVPDDIALSGFDGFSSSEFGWVPVSTVLHPIDEIARGAVDCLLDAIRSRKPAKPRRVRFRGKLAIRCSCGACTKSERVQ